MANKRIRYIPDKVTDILMHGHDSDRTERVLMPITRYGAILNAPSVVQEDITTYGAPFHLLETDTVVLNEEEIRNLCGRIV
jgi:hypothetical protein